MQEKGSIMSGYRSHVDLPVFQKAYANAQSIFQLSRSFPREETYSLTDQIRRSSRSVCANIAEAWRKRRYEKHFVSTLNVAEAEAAETQVWIRFACDCGYATPDTGDALFQDYDEVIAQIVYLIHHSDRWVIRRD